MSFFRKVARRVNRKGLAGVKLPCPTHGKSAWLGDIVCKNCKRIYMREGESYPTIQKDGFCVCGGLLLPQERYGQEQELAAEAICHFCAAALSEAVRDAEDENLSPYSASIRAIEALRKAR